MPEWTPVQGPGGTDELAQVAALELELLRPDVRRSRERVEALLDPAFTEVGASGRLWTRPAIVAAMLVEHPQPALSASEVQGRVLAPGLVLLTYVSEVPGVRRARRTSLWRRTDGSWRVVHHQGTPLALHEEP
jgi:hypothetical protein